MRSLQRPAPRILGDAFPLRLRRARLDAERRRARLARVARLFNPLREHAHFALVPVIIVVALLVLR